MKLDGQQLWCAVIEQAIIDATAPISKRLSVRMDQQRAREWLTQPNDDFEEVCALAGLEAGRVRTMATRQINSAIEHHRNTTPGVGQSPSRNASDRSPRVAQDSV
jgi:hypothetical protein